MNIEQLQCFLTVADTLNFARAAEQLHVTQPAVTQQIRALERELGVMLFRRTTRSVRITEEGLAFFDDARRMVELAHRAVQRFAHADLKPVRPLSIGCHSLAHLLLLIPVLRELAAQYPDLHPRLQAVPFQHLYRFLEEGDVDAVLAFRQPDSRKNSPFRYRELCRTSFTCLCAAGHPLAAQSSVTLEDLADQKLVLLDPGRARLEAAGVQAELVREHSPSDLYFCESAEAMIVLVQAGFGVSLLPNLLIPRNVSLVHLPLQGMPPVSFGVYYREQQSDELLKALIRSLQALDWPV